MSLTKIRKCNGLRFELYGIPALGVCFWRHETFYFDLYDSPYREIGQPSAELGGQIKLVNFVPEFIVPTIVKDFLNINEGRYYMFISVEAFHNGLAETKKVVVC